MSYKNLKMLWIIPGSEKDLKWANVRLRHYNVYKELRNKIDADILFGVMGSPVEDLISFVKKYDIVVLMDQSLKDLKLLEGIRGHTVSLRDHSENIFQFPMQKECFQAASTIACCSLSLRELTEKIYNVDTELIPDMWETSSKTPPSNKTQNLRILCAASHGAFEFYNQWSPYFTQKGYETILLTDRPESYPGSIKWDRGTWEKYYAQADVIACPQCIQPNRINAQSSSKLVQAMAYGKPCIASPIPSYKELVVQGENGFIVNKIEDLLYIAEELKNPEIRKKLHNNSLQTSAKFSPEKISDMWLKAGLDRLVS